MKVSSYTSTFLLLFLSTIGIGLLHGQSQSIQLKIPSAISANEDNRSVDVSIQALMGNTPYDKLEPADIKVFQDEQALTVIFFDTEEAERGIYLLQLRDESMFYTGEPHEIRVEWTDQKDGFSTSASAMFSAGSLLNPFPSPQQYSWMDIMVIGLLIVALLLLFLSEGTSLFDRLFFRMKYVRPYREVKMPKVTKHDPLTGDPFQDDELVVVRCRLMTSLDTWTFKNHRCMDYPECMYAANPCQDGETSVGHEKFFSQRGIFKKFNWLWLGSLGGAIAGLIWTALKGKVNVYFDQALLGFVLGLTLASALALAEERGQGRAFSWLRIGIRGISGAGLGLIIFLIGSFGGNGYLIQLIIWILFGASLGFVLSLNSSILPLRGTLAGLAGSLLGFNLYYVLLNFSKNDSLSLVISLICFGATMAIIMVTVIHRLEDFEMEVLSPPEYRRSIPISKWLRRQIDIFVGTDPSNYVRVMWKEADVLPQHVQLSYDNKHVYIEPLGETLLNGRQISLNKKIPLKNGDILQLGRESMTRMQYHERTVSK